MLCGSRTNHWLASKYIEGMDAIRIYGLEHAVVMQSLRMEGTSAKAIIFHEQFFMTLQLADHHHHHLELQPFVGSRLLSQVSPSSSVLSCFLPVFFSSFFKSSMTSYCHRCLGLPTGLVPIGFQSNSFLVGLAWSILCIWPSHLILCALMDLTVSAPSINLSIFMLFHILHMLSIMTGPNIFLSVCLS